MRKRITNFVLEIFIPVKPRALASLTVPHLNLITRSNVLVTVHKRGFNKPLL